MEQLVAMTGASGPEMHTLVVRRGAQVASLKIPQGRIGVELETVKAQQETALARSSASVPPQPKLPARRTPR
jgi:hypothetical protein